MKLHNFASLVICCFALSGCSSISEKFYNFFDDEEAKSDVRLFALNSIKAGAEAESSETGTVSEGVKKLWTERAREGFEQYSQTLLPGTEVSLSGGENTSSDLSILTIQELGKNDEINNTYFFQGGLSNHDSGDRTTANLGLGYRYLTDDERWLYGINVFFDHELPYDHQRGSVGLELKSSAFDLSMNRYKALTDWKNSGASKQERALDGSEIELGIQIPYVPSAKGNISSFKWDGTGSSNNIEGNSYSLYLNQPSGGGWSIEAGIHNFDDRPDESFGRITYHIGRGRDVSSNEVRPFFSKSIFESASISNRRLEKVRRSNKIVKQTGGFTVSFR